MDPKRRIFHYSVIFYTSQYSSLFSSYSHFDWKCRYFLKKWRKMMTAVSKKRCTFAPWFDTIHRGAFLCSLVLLLVLLACAARLCSFTFHLSPFSSQKGVIRGWLGGYYGVIRGIFVTHCRGSDKQYSLIKYPIIQKKSFFSCIFQKLFVILQAKLMN